MRYKNITIVIETIAFISSCALGGAQNVVRPQDGTRVADAAKGAVNAGQSPASSPTPAISAIKGSKTKSQPRTKLDSLPVAMAKSRVTMDFRDASIDQILSFFSVTSGLTVIKDPGLTGTATLISPRPISLTDAFAILEALLDTRGYRMERTAVMLRISPKGRGDGGSGSFGGFGPGRFGGSGIDNPAGSGGTGDPSGLGSGNPGGPGGFGGFGRAGGRGAEQTQVFQLKYASAKSVATIVNDLFKTAGSGGSGSSSSRGNAGGSGGGFRGGPGGGFPGGPGGDQSPGNNDQSSANNNQAASASGGTARASSDDYSNTVIVTGPANQLAQISTMITQIDQPVGSTQVTQVFPLTYIDASSAASVVSGVLMANNQGGARSGASSNIPFEQRARMSAFMGSSAASSGQVVAHTETNSLIVTASDESLSLVEQVLKELDRPQKVQSTTYVRSLQNVSASDVADLLTSLYGRKSGTGSTSTGTSSNSLSQRQRSTNNPFGQNRNSSLGNNSFGNNGMRNGGGGSVTFGP